MFSHFFMLVVVFYSSIIYSFFEFCVLIIPFLMQALVGLSLFQKIHDPVSVSCACKMNICTPPSTYMYGPVRGGGGEGYGWIVSLHMFSSQPNFLDVVQSVDLSFTQISLVTPHFFSFNPFKNLKIAYDELPILRKFSCFRFANYFWLWSTVWGLVLSKYFIVYCVFRTLQILFC